MTTKGLSLYLPKQEQRQRHARQKDGDLLAYCVRRAAGGVFGRQLCLKDERFAITTGSARGSVVLFVTIAIVM